MGVFNLLALIFIWIHLFSTLREKHTILPVLDRWVRLWQNVTFPIRRARKGFLQRCSKGMNVSGTALDWKESIRHGGYLSSNKCEGYQLRHEVFYWKCATLLSSSLLLSAGKGELDNTWCRLYWDCRCSTCRPCTETQKASSNFLWLTVSSVTTA